jgi:aminomethyltransferase
MRRTLLYNWHVEHKAKMIEFAGWEMPLYYTSIRDEHLQVRNYAGIFDLCHMGRIRIRGKDRIEFLQMMATNDLQELAENQVQYSFVCNRQGGVIDDITIYRALDYLMLVVNAINREVAIAWLNQHKSGYEIEIEDATLPLCMLSLQGPNSESILQEIVDRTDLSSLRYYHFVVAVVEGAKALVSRTGYTGEDGFEIFVGALYAKSVWDNLLRAGKPYGLVPIGLGARDTLRLEACMPLYGNELTTFTSPLEAGLERFVKFNKRANFIGKAPLVHSTNTEFTKRLVAFQMLDGSIPRKGCAVVADEIPIGNVTSGTYSPTLRKGIGMGYIDQFKAQVGKTMQVVIHDRPHPAVIVSRPFYKRQKPSPKEQQKNGRD